MSVRNRIHYAIVSCTPETTTMSVSCTISEIFSVKEWHDLGVRSVQGYWKWRHLIDHIPLFIGLPLYIKLYLVPFLRYLTLKNIVTLKSGLELVKVLDAHQYFRCLI